MALAGFVQGALMEIGGRRMALKREVADDLWQIEDCRTGRIHEFSLDELRGKYAAGELVFVNNTAKSLPAVQNRPDRVVELRANVPPALWERAKVRRHFVLAVLDLPITENLLIPAIRQAWEKLGQGGNPPHWTNVAKWKKRYLEAGKDIFVLVDAFHARGNHNRRYPIEVLELVEDAVEAIYLKRERNSMEDTLEHALTLVDRENKLLPSSMQLPLPTIRLVKAKIAEIPAYDRYAARYGRMAAIRKFRTVLHSPVTERPLQRAEIDHTQLDIFVLDDETLMPLGRPWVTVCIDCHTRCILGIWISFTPPSYITVARCLRHAFLPKVDLQEQFPEVRHRWEAHGVMEELVMDNGLEFHGGALEAACFSIGITIQYTPRKMPWYKGKIERFMRTLNDGVAHGMPGTTFSNIFEKDDYDPSKHAVLTLGALRTVVMKWVTDYYHQKPHRALDGASPSQMWRSSIHDDAIPLPDDPARLDVLLGKPVSRKLTHKGIEWECLFYNSPELAALRQQFGAELDDVEIRVDEGDIGVIHVKLPDDSGYVRAPALRTDYASGISLWQHKIYRKYAAQHLGGDDPLVWAKAKVEITEIVQRAFADKRRKSNALIGRYLENQPPRQPKVKKDKTSKGMPEIVAAEPVVVATTLAAEPMPSLPTPGLAVRPRFTPIVMNRNSPSPSAN